MHKTWCKCLGGGLVVWEQHSQRLVELLPGSKQDTGLSPEGAQAPHRAWGSRSTLPGAGWSLATTLLTRLCWGLTMGRGGWQGGWGCWYKTDPVSLALSSFIPSTFSLSGDEMNTESYSIDLNVNIEAHCTHNSHLTRDWVASHHPEQKANSISYSTQYQKLVGRF